MQKSRLRRAWMIPGIVTAILFVGGVASNLVASHLQTTLQPYMRWVYLICGVALIVTVVGAIIEARRRTLSPVSNAPTDHSTTAEATPIVSASGNRSRVTCDVNDSILLNGDKNVIGGRDAYVAGKIVNIHQLPDYPHKALHQIPPAPADFTGREDARRELCASIEHSGITIVGLQGLGGIGKTALALKLVEQIKPRYPDAQFYLDLKGASTQPLTVSEALAHVVRAYNPAIKLPDSETELRGFYLSVLDGQRALLLLDNAGSAAQVEPLIPPASCLLLVTSRWHFSLPGLASKSLDTLNPADARALLLKIEPRIGAWADEIAALCGHLPMALRLAASAIVKYVNLKPSDYIRRLRDERQRLQLIEASLTLSYQLLSEELRQSWRRLAVFPDTFDGEAAAAIWEVETDKAHGTLGELIAASFVEWNETNGRYRLHDLARLFADAKLSAKERVVVQKRFAMHYRDVIAAANDLYLEGGESLLRGLALLDLEWGNIQVGHAWVAAQEDAADEDVARLGIEYPEAGPNALYLRQQPHEWIRWLEISLVAARRLKDRACEGAVLCNLGIAYADLGESRRAIEFHEQFLTAAREFGDRKAEGKAYNNLGNVYADLGETHKAIELYQHQLRIVSEIGDRRCEGIALGNLGLAYADLGETERAITFYKQRLIIAREIGDRQGEGTVLGNLGRAHADLGETNQAIEFYQQQLTIVHEIGDRRGEGNALCYLGNAYLQLDEIQQSIKFYQQSLTVAREIADHRGEGNALWNLSQAMYLLGEQTQGIEHAEQGLRILEHIEDRNVAKIRAKLAEWRKEVDDN